MAPSYLPSERRAYGLARWFASTSVCEEPEVRHAMHLTLREPVYLTMVAFLWTQTAGLCLMAIAGAAWALPWLAADLFLFLARLKASKRIDEAESDEQSRLPTAATFVLHAVWIGTVALGSFLTASQSDVRLVLMGTILPIGFSGYVVSRWQAFPRCATAFIYALWGALFAGLLCSSFPGGADMAWLMPAGALAFQILLRLNHTILLTALRAQQENRRLSMHDPLTGLPNRLMLKERLTKLCARLSHHPDGRGFAVLCLDLDGFKGVNDRHGHAAGDLLLTSVSQRLAASVRSQDLVARLGGDEFVILLPDSTAAEAIPIAERLLASVGQLHALTPLVSIAGGLSVGISLAPLHGQSPDALLASADSALYAAKRTGKGCWCFPSRAAMTPP